MGVILDTCVWIEIEREKLTFDDVDRLTWGLPVYLAPPVLAELEYVCYRTKTDTQRIRYKNAIKLIKQNPCLPIDVNTAKIFARLSAKLDSVGKPATHRTHDIWIAALAIQYDFAVLTLNMKDFQGIPDVRLLPASPKT